VLLQKRVARVVDSLKNTEKEREREVEDGKKKKEERLRSLLLPHCSYSS